MYLWELSNQLYGQTEIFLSLMMYFILSTLVFMGHHSGEQNMHGSYKTWEAEARYPVKVIVHILHDIDCMLCN